MNNLLYTGGGAPSSVEPILGRNKSFSSVPRPVYQIDEVVMSKGRDWEVAGAMLLGIWGTQ